MAGGWFLLSVRVLSRKVNEDVSARLRCRADLSIDAGGSAAEKKGRMKFGESFRTVNVCAIHVIRVLRFT
jgi:hypothetical protein